MKLIYKTYEKSNSFFINTYASKYYYLCESEEEYKEIRDKCIALDKENHQKEIYKRYPQQMPKLSEEKEMEAREYYLEGEWLGKDFTFAGFSYCIIDAIENSKETYFIKPGTIEEVTSQIDNDPAFICGYSTLFKNGSTPESSQLFID